uniref:Uncharacterized protein n=1 Tax=Peronospora matthiolae TaxID=2874970 RepID=A0AAV1UK75_9STRA
MVIQAREKHEAQTSNDDGSFGGTSSGRQRSTITPSASGV